MDDRIRVNPQQLFCEQFRVTSATTEARFGLDWTATARLADAHTVAVQRWLSSRAPGARRLAGLGVTATSTGLAVPLLNLATGAHYPPETPVAVIDEEIAAVKAFFAARHVPFTWWLGPFPSPVEMGAHLRRHGFRLRDYRLPAMVAPLTESARWPTGNPRAEIWQARSRADLAAASTIRRAAFRFPAGTARTYFEDQAEEWLRGAPARVYLARLDPTGPPVALGALILGAGVPGVYVMATLPVWEGRGLGKAILARMLGDAAAEGHTLIVLTAGARAYSLYRKFGFEHIFEYELYRLEEE